jgi:hypothetical protein
MVVVVLVVATPEEWLFLGLQSVGFGPTRQNRLHDTNMERFLAHFGASPESLCAIFLDLQTTHIEAARIAKPSIAHFLMAMHWLKTYPSDAVIAGTFKVDEKTARTQVWKYILAIQALKEQKVIAITEHFCLLQTLLVLTLFAFHVPYLLYLFYYH